MLLTQLVEALIDYASAKEFKTEMRATRLALQQAFAPNSLAFVDAVRQSGKVTSYGMELLNSQAEQAMQYTVERVEAMPGPSDAELPEPEFVVKRAQSAATAAAELDWTDESTLRAADYNLLCREPTEGRRCSRKKCSCQFFISVGYAR